MNIGSTTLRSAFITAYAPHIGEAKNIYQSAKLKLISRNLNWLLKTGKSRSRKSLIDRKTNGRHLYDSVQAFIRNMECRVLRNEILSHLYRLCSIVTAYTVPHEKMALAHSLWTVTTSFGVSRCNVMLTKLLLDSTIIQIGSVHRLTSYFFKIHFNITYHNKCVSKVVSCLHFCP